MSEHIEIERKFLVISDTWREHVRDSFPLDQGYLASSKELAVRVRRKRERAILTIKGAAHGAGLARREFEYDVPVEDAEVLLAELCPGGRVSKTRHLVDFGGLTWEVDVFSGPNAPLIIAEVELSREDEVFDIPDWVGEDVSHDERYLNAYLARHPFSSWGDKLDASSSLAQRDER